MLFGLVLSKYDKVLDMRLPFWLSWLKQIEKIKKGV
jgi:hypothetical protein